MFGDKFNNLVQSNVDEIKENPLRFAAVVICFVVAVCLFFADYDDEQIILDDSPPPAETAEKIIVVADKNITPVLGANSDTLYVADPFKVPPKPKIETPPPVEIPPVIIPPPVAQEPPKPDVKFILRGTAIVGDKKSAILQQISADKNSDAENLIVEVGEILNGKIILDIAQDSLTFSDGEILFLDFQN